MAFCPECRCEHKPGIKECPFCSARLVDKLIVKKIKPAVKGKNKEKNLVRLRNFPSSVYAYMLQGALENEGINAVIKDENKQTVPVHFNGSSNQAGRSVTVWVPKKDYHTCKEITDQMFSDI
jgi:hypothetical protein